MDKWKIGYYLRLSKDDGMENAESNSISSQRIIIRQFIRDYLPESEYIKEYADDGYTGLNFDRPKIKELLRDIRSGSINCVVVKDFSRFGRDYLETGKYIFNDFPLEGIRFIAINDNYDSLNTNSSDRFMMPMKTMMNNYYSMDISDKVQKAFRAKQKAGQFTGAFAGYGFLKDETDKHVLKIDENTAPVIRKIFDLYLSGQGKQAIANKLNEEGIPCPSAYKKLMGSNYHNSNKLDTTNYWTYSTIARILTNEMYIGNMVLNKSFRVKPRGRARENAKENWIVTEGTHEAIISMEKWELTQSLLKKRGRQTNFKSKVSMFAGFIVCADCGRAMARITNKREKSQSTCYICGSYKRYGSGICSRHCISEKVLEKAVLDAINLYIAKSDIIMEKICMEGIGAERPKSAGRVKKYDNVLSTLKAKKKKLYEAYTEGVITQEEYREYKNDYESDEKKYKALMSAAVYEEERFKNEKFQWAEKVCKQKRLEGLDRGILAEVLNKVYVHEDNGKIQADICFRFILEP